MGQAKQRATNIWTDTWILLWFILRPSVSTLRIASMEEILVTNEYEIISKAAVGA